MWGKSLFGCFWIPELSLQHTGAVDCEAARHRGLVDVAVHSMHSHLVWEKDAAKLAFYQY